MIKILFHKLIIFFLNCIMFFACISDVIAQNSKEMESILQTIKKATPKAEEGYKQKKAKLLLNAVKILLKNESFATKVSYKTNLTNKEEVYDNLLDIDELFENISVLLVDTSQKVFFSRKMKRLAKYYNKYERMQWNSMDKADESIEISAYEIDSKSESKHKIDCKKRTTISFKSPKQALHLYIDNIDLEKQKSWSNVVPIGTCIIQVINDNSQNIKYYIMTKAH
ncbi:MAG: hypothetical protein ACPG5B_13885 [Chitinophagales bacterium]